MVSTVAYIIRFACFLLFTCCAVHTLYAQSSDTTKVFFPFDQAVLTEDAKEEINQFISTYKTANATSSLIIRGHCDAIGSNAYNDDLSNRRANTIRNYLIAQGVSGDVILLTKGFGETEPLNSNTTAAERQLNRRVEIIWNKINTTVTDATQPTPRDTVPSLTQETIRTVEEGQTLRLQNINFIGGRHTFLPQSEPALKNLLTIMKNNPTLVIEIQGHICCLPGTARDGFDYDANDFNLSHNRARAVYDFLYKNGIEANRMSYKGFAGRVPLVYPEYTEEDRTANRRVEIKIIRK